MMKRTWLLVTFTGTAFTPAAVFSEFTLISCVGDMVHTGSLPVTARAEQASPANAPTRLIGALLLPTNGRAVSVPTNAPMKAESKKLPAEVSAATSEFCDGV